VHPIFFYELGSHARVVEDPMRAQTGEFVGFLLGFITQVSASTPSTGYVHLVGIDPAYRRRGVGRALYREFTQSCVAAGVRRLKAITTAGNEGSLRFHEALGFSAHEDVDYAGPGRKRIVFTRAL
jgi:ribosomal protein S18 acetylase RimI-like enzyme